MKTNKLLAAGALALSMAMTPVASLISAMPVSAATITIKESGADEILHNHTFTAYQIFSGVEANGTLTGIKWSEDFNSSKLLDSLKTSSDQAFLVDGKNPFADAENAAEVANILTNHQDNSDLLDAFARLAVECVEGSGISLQAGPNDNIDSGYYVIVDTTDVNGKDTAVNKTLLQVVGDIEINVKTSIPTLEKKVYEDTKYSNSDNPYGEGYNDVADHEIGTDVPFSFYSKVPDMAQYETYKYIIHDTMDQGLTFNPNSVSVKIGDKTLTTNEYRITGGITGETFAIEIDNLKSIQGIQTGQEIKVTFTAKLNENAVIGLPGNTNEVYLEYSNNPYDENDTGHGAKDKVVVFTYEMDITKVDNADESITLSGAKFYLKDDTRLSDDGSVGKYAVFSDGSDGHPQKGTILRWVSSLEDVLNGWETTTLESDENGLFQVFGLDDGTYTLHEYEAPEGYVIPENGKDFTVTIKANTTNTQNWDGQSDALADYDKKLSENEYSVVIDHPTTENPNGGYAKAEVTVTNSTSANLPETGGMGTTLIYGAGALMVAGAAVVFVTNKRTRKN